MLAPVVLLPLPLALGLAAAAPLQQTPPTRDSVVQREVVRDSARADSTRARGVTFGTGRDFRRIPVTPAHIATAFADARARSLLERAREARLRQDSSLESYDAKGFQRISVGMSFKAIGRDRLFFRHEGAARIRWRRDVGAVIDVLGSRAVLPAIEGPEPNAGEGGMSSLPYYPGRDDLWFGAEVVEAERDDVPVVHPIAGGAEAYYRYAVGDSVIFRLPDGSTVQLTELRVRPREPNWRLAVGSLWFDASTAQLVRAVYRLSVPLDLWVDTEVGAELEEEDDIPLVAKALIQPLKATVSSLVIEHGLYEGRYWLPRAQSAEGEVQVGFLRVPVRIDERFDYLSVNGTLDEMPDVPIEAPWEADSIRADSLGLTGEERREWIREQRRARRDSVEARCSEPGAERVRVQNRYGHVPTLVRVPCDTLALMHSAELPPSIYAPEEELFIEQDLQELQSMVGFSAQAGFKPQRPVLVYGPGAGLLRYNRVEGVSAGLGVRQLLGKGFAVDARAQIGVADWEPNGELALSRTDGMRTVRLGAYRRLAVANDWGTPLSFGSSLNAVLFGRDEGFYYRTLGAEFVAVGERDTRFEWRAFIERHDDADVETHFSLAHALHGLRFDENIESEDGTMLGVGARITRTWGLDPRGFRLFGDLRLEAGTGDFAFSRAALDLSLSRALGDVAAVSLLGSVGSTGGVVPPQRLFYLGGTSTVRGQTPGTMAGDAYWMGRLEVGTSRVAVRPVAFFDLGWAGPRGDWRHPGRPMTGAGVGLSFLDGLIRMDVARGIWPRERFTMSLYLDALF